MESSGDFGFLLLDIYLVFSSLPWPGMTLLTFFRSRCNCFVAGFSYVVCVLLFVGVVWSVLPSFSSSIYMVFGYVELWWLVSRCLFMSISGALFPLSLSPFELHALIYNEIPGHLGGETENFFLFVYWDFLG